MTMFGIGRIATGWLLALALSAGLGALSGCGSAGSGAAPTGSGGHTDISVSPLSDFIANGPVGGPFTPASQLYTVTNNDATAHDWDLASPAAWLSFDHTSGSLAAGASLNVTASIEATVASSMAAGVYSSTISIRDTSTGAIEVLVARLTISNGPILSVVPAGTFDSTGPIGGPFAPAFADYTLQNTGSVLLHWSVTVNQPWLTLSAASGQLAPNATAAVRVTIESALANAMAIGVHAAQISFVNADDGVGSTTRPVSLNITGAGLLVVSPTTDLTMSGPEGGPFTPSQQGYLLQNVGTASIAWQVSTTQPWLVVQGTSTGNLAPGASVPVTVELSASVANQLTVGSHAADILFEDLTDASTITVHATLNVTASGGGGGGGGAVIDLTPGAGFAGPTSTPPPVGTGPGIDAVPIAHWNVVPYQDIAAPMDIGIVAFHRNGISRVEMSLQGGPWSPITQVNLNVATGTWEYLARLRPSLVGFDGPIEVRAIVFPVVGTPRLMPSLFLNANHGGSLPVVERWVDAVSGQANGTGTQQNPVDSIERALATLGTQGDGARIVLKAGNHAWPGSAPWPQVVTQQRWLTITRDPAATQSQVIIATQGPGGTDGTKTLLTAVRGVTIRTPWRVAYPGAGPLPKIWVADCRMEDPAGRWAGFEVFHYPLTTFSAAYATECTYDNVHFGPIQYTLVRNVHCTRIGEDAFTDSRAVINCSVVDIDASGLPGAHPDVFAFDLPGNIENVLVYNLRATKFASQGLHLRPQGTISTSSYNNFAVVNCVFAASPGLAFTSNWIAPTNHFLLWHCSFSDQSLRMMSQSQSNVQIRNCIIDKFTIEDGLSGTQLTSLPAGAEMDNNQFAKGGQVNGGLTLGSNAANGSPSYVNSATFDLHLQNPSPCRDRVTLPILGHDCMNQPLVMPAAIGSYKQ